MSATRRDVTSSEREFHNRRAQVEGSAGDRLSYVYRSMGDVLSIPTDRLAAIKGAVLEVGCYLGDNALKATSAESYVGVDISDVAIEKARERFGTKNVSFRCVDANHLEILGAQFDYVFGNGVIHHLDLEKFCLGMSKVMRPAAKAVFVEPMLGPPWIRWFRKLTPKMRTTDEHPLDDGQIAVLGKHFNIEIEHFGLIRPLLPMLCGNLRPAIQYSMWLDRQVMRTPAARRMAWLVAMTLTRRDAQR